MCCFRLFQMGKESQKQKGSYRKINGCSGQIQCEQCFWFAYCCLLLGMHSGLVLPPLVQWQSSISTLLLVLAILVYVLFLIVFIAYCILTCQDPVDLHIIREGSHQNQENLKFCSLCKTNVSLGTEHCLSCNRCTSNFDHHSQLINNCISLNNMKSYIGMNVSFTLAMGLITAISLTLFVMNHSDSQLVGLISNKWALMVLIILTFLSFLFSLFNTIFTIYLRCLGRTRIEHKFRDTDSNNSDFSDQIEKESQEMVQSS